MDEEPVRGWGMGLLQPSAARAGKGRLFVDAELRHYSANG